MIEIERRYKIQDVSSAINLLNRNGIDLKKKDHIIDEWFAPKEIKSHGQQIQWFDKDRGIAYRIRRTEQTNGSFLVKVESKQLTSVANHNTFIEKTIDSKNYEQAEQFLEGIDYWNWLTIDKSRYLFMTKNPEFELIIDEIEGLKDKIGIGAVLEIEYKGQDDRTLALEKIDQFANNLGFLKTQLFEKSLTVEAMTELAKFA